MNQKARFSRPGRLVFWWSLVSLWVIASLATGCDCGGPPSQNENTTQTDGGTIRPDDTTDKTAVTDDTTPDAAPDQTNPDPVVCYSLGDPCGANGGCDPSCSGSPLSCQEGICQSAVQPDRPPVDQQCPSRCSNHDDCRNNTACGERRDCINGVCTVPARLCPRRCRSDKDCQTPLCGSRIRCNQGACDELPKCPAGCTEDSDCDVAACGARKLCLNGTCAAPPKNDPPQAVAEKSQKVEVGTRVQLDGSKSSDPDGDPITYRWNIVKRPAGSLTAFDNDTAATPAFVPDREGDYLIALVVNDGNVDSPPASVTITAVKKVLPAPQISSFSPAQLPEGSSNLKVRVFGQNFVSGAQLSFNNLILTTSFVNSTEVVVTLPTGLRAGSYPVFLQNPDGSKSNTVNYTIVKQPNDPPVLINLAPVEVTAGQAFSLTLNGDKFLNGAEVYLNSTAYSATFVSSKRLTASIGALNAGVYNVQVRNPDGQSSATLTLRVVTVAKGPVLKSLSPNSAFAQQSFLLVLAGERFAKGATVKIGSQTYQSVFVSDTQIRVTNLSIATAGFYPVEVSNPGGLTSNRLSLEIKTPLSKPIITLLVPSSIQEKTAVTIAVRGNDFASGATVSVDGTDYPTSFVSAGELRVTLPNTLAQGTYDVLVTNPDKQASNKATLTVVAAATRPVLRALKPNRVPVGITSTVLVTGSNFQNGAQLQVGARLVPTTFGSDTELKAQIPSSLKAGTYNVRVFNPGNQTSNTLKLEVYQAPAPVIKSLIPNKGTSGSVVTVRVLGANFYAKSTVLFQGGAQPTSYVSGTELTVTLSLSSLNPATYSLWVRNPDNQISNKVKFLVEAPQGPQITNLLPKEGQTGTTVNVIVNGARFGTGAIVDFNGKIYKTTFLNASTLGVNLDLKGVAAGTYPLSVVNPNKDTSNIVYFTVTANKLPAPVITQVKPSSIKISQVGANNPIYILGRHFQNGALFTFRVPIVGSIGLPTNFINSQTLVVTAQFPRIPFPFPAQRTNVFVTNPDKQTSNSVQVTIAP